MTEPTSSEIVERKAFEIYILELVRGYARANAEKGGIELAVVRDADLVGSYPDTAVRLTVYLPGVDQEQERIYGIWNCPMFFDEHGTALMPGPPMAGYIMMWAQGG